MKLSELVKVLEEIKALDWDTHETCGRYKNYRRKVREKVQKILDLEI